MWLRAIVAACFVLGFLGVLTAFVILSLNGKDTGLLVAFATGAATTIFPQLITLLKTHNTEQQVKSVNADVQEIKQRTNGPLTEMQHQVQQIAEHVGCDKEGDAS